MMKHISISLCIGLCIASCQPSTFTPKTGDLLFQVSETSGMADAITASTGSDELTYTHVAIVIGGNSVIEATGADGVRRTSLIAFLASSAQTPKGAAVVVMRLRDTTGTAASIRRALVYEGQPYDYSYLPCNGKMYCSELVYESYLRPNGSRIFTSNPMNFRDAEGHMPEFWTDLFAELGESIPEGVPGTNPNDLSKEPILKEIYRYF